MKVLCKLNVITNQRYWLILFIPVFYAECCDLLREEIPLLFDHRIADISFLIYCLVALFLVSLAFVETLLVLPS